jgi:Uma2 family endonuclease
MVALATIPVRMSVDEFLAWASSAGGSWQLVDGVPQAMSPASRTHGVLQGELGSLIRNHLRESGSKCSLVTAPGVVPRALSEHNMRVPDLSVTCSSYDQEEYALTDPVLIVEILSPSNQAATWNNVWAYTSIPSVQEILVLRSDRIGATLLRRLVDATWPERPAEVTDGNLELASIGFSVPLRDIYIGTRLRA